jgi:hypothetical protein
LTFHSTDPISTDGEHKVVSIAPGTWVALSYNGNLGEATVTVGWWGGRFRPFRVNGEDVTLSDDQDLYILNVGPIGDIYLKVEGAAGTSITPLVAKVLKDAL